MRHFLSRVLTSRIRAGVRAGLVSAAATAGAITGFGIHQADWSGPFASLGSQVMRGFGVTDAPRFILSTVGMTAHAAWMVLWGIAFAALAYRRSASITLLLGALIGAVAALTAGSLVPAAMGAVRFAALPGVQATLCVALMTVGLVTGRALSPAD